MIESLALLVAMCLTVQISPSKSIFDPFFFLFQTVIVSNAIYFFISERESSSNTQLLHILAFCCALFFIFLLKIKKAKLFKIKSPWRNSNLNSKKLDKYQTVLALFLLISAIVNCLFYLSSGEGGDFRNISSNALTVYLQWLLTYIAIAFLIIQKFQIQTVVPRVVLLIYSLSILFMTMQGSKGIIFTILPFLYLMAVRPGKVEYATIAGSDVYKLVIPIAIAGFIWLLIIIYSRGVGVDYLLTRLRNINSMLIFGEHVGVPVLEPSWWKLYLPKRIFGEVANFGNELKLSYLRMSDPEISYVVGGPVATMPFVFFYALTSLDEIALFYGGVFLGYYYGISGIWSPSLVRRLGGWVLVTSLPVYFLDVYDFWLKFIPTFFLMFFAHLFVRIAAKK
jgi:hypothetical protein